MAQRLIIEDDTVTREIDVGNGVINRDARKLSVFAEQLAQHVPLETGVLPPGVLSIRQAGDHLQVVLQARPGINYIHWTEYEGDGKEKLYTLAQPWRVIVADFLAGDLMGARMFYSPVPVAAMDQQLYHQNVPNLNCRGYRNNGVGWVCLYASDSLKESTLAQKILRVLERCSGVEVYNDGNMSETDGPRFYAAMGKPAFLSDPTLWEKKTEAEGFEWTLDPDLWIPVMVKDTDDQQAHHQGNGGIPLTLGMAMHGNAAVHYGDKYLPKLINAIARDDLPVPHGDFLEKVFTQAFVDSGEQLKPPTIEAKKVLGKKPVPQVNVVAKPKVGYKAAYVAPVPKVMHKCQHCGELVKYGDPAPEKLVCFNCLQVTCPNCDLYQAKLVEGGCTKCTKHEECWTCYAPIAGAQDHEVKVPSLKKPIHLCDDHFEVARICSSCGLLRHEDDVHATNEGQDLCEQCTRYCAHCGRPFLLEGDIAACNDCIAVNEEKVLLKVKAG